MSMQNYKVSLFVGDIVELKNNTFIIAAIQGGDPGSIRFVTLNDPTKGFFWSRPQFEEYIIPNLIRIISSDGEVTTLPLIKNTDLLINLEL